MLSKLALNVSSSVLCLLFTTDALATAPREASEQFLLQAAGQFNATLECPDRIWPNLSWADLEIVLIDKANNLAVIWNAGSTRTNNKGRTPLLVDTAEHFPNGSGFEFIPRERRLLVYREVENTPDGLAIFAMHELFHITGQQQMYRGGMRGLLFPENAEPRYFRLELINALLRFANSGRKESLRRAAFWHHLYAREFADDYQDSRGSDVREGTAEYVSTIAQALGKEGCGISDHRLDKIIEARLSPKKISTISKEKEPYAVGWLSALALRKIRSPRWQARVASGTPISEVLFEKVKPSKTKEKQRIKAEVASFIKEENSKLIPILKEFEKAISTPEYVVIAIPSLWRRGSYSVKRHISFIFRGMKLTFYDEGSATFIHPLTRSSLELTSANCGVTLLTGLGEYWYCGVQRELVQILGSTLVSGSSRDMKAGLFQFRRTNVAGFPQPWLVLE
jgi:hypothetical protein